MKLLKKIFLHVESQAIKFEGAVRPCIHRNFFAGLLVVIWIVNSLKLVLAIIQVT